MIIFSPRFMMIPGSLVFSSRVMRYVTSVSFSSSSSRTYSPWMSLMGPSSTDFVVHVMPPSSSV